MKEVFKDGEPRQSEHVIQELERIMEEQLTTRVNIDAKIKPVSEISTEMRNLDLHYEYRQVTIFVTGSSEHKWTWLSIKCERDDNVPN